MGLKDKHILVTRATDQSADFTRGLEQRGAVVLPFPVIEITGPENEDVCRGMIKSLMDYDWIIFTSANALKYLIHLGYDLKNLTGSPRIACVGGKTARLLEKYGIIANLVPNEFTADALVASLISRDINGQRILLPVSDLADGELPRGLSEAGAKITPVVVYRNRPFINPQREEMWDRFKANEIACVTFFSPSAVHAFTSQMNPDVITLINNTGVTIAVIGPTTKVAAESAGFKTIIRPEVNDGAHLLRAIENYYA